MTVGEFVARRLVEWSIRSASPRRAPGAIHLLNRLYDAKMDHQPVVAIVGQSGTTALGSSYRQEVDLLSLFKDVAGEYCQQVPEAGGVLKQAVKAVADTILPR